MQMHRIVDIQKKSITRRAETKQRSEKFYVYHTLKEECQDKLHGININCEACEKNYNVQIKKEGQEFTDFRISCCLFCGQQIKFY